MFEVTHHAIEDARELGLGGDAQELADMLASFAEFSALVTHADGNRRFGGYVLDVGDGLVYSVSKYDPTQKICSACHGVGHVWTQKGDTWTADSCKECQQC